MKEELSKLLITGDWNRFAKETGPYWRSLARRLRRRWDVPEAVEEEDVAQELMLGAMRSVEQYDPERGDAFAYVRWRAEREARRWLNKQRQSPRYSDMAQSRYPLRCEDSDEMLVEQPIQERVAEAREQLDAIITNAGDDLGDAICAWVQSGADISAVATTPKTRKQFRDALAEHRGRLT